MKYFHFILLAPLYIIWGLLIPLSASAVVNGGTKEIKVGESIKLEVERSTYYTVTGSWTKEGNSAYISSRSSRSCTVTGSQAGTTTIRWKGVIGSTDSEWYWTIKVAGSGSNSGSDSDTSGTKNSPDTGFSDNWGSNGNYSMSWYEKEKMEYHLSTAEELAGFAYLVNQGYTTFKGKTVKLDGDVDLYGKNWPMIGVTTGSYDKVFEGTFDGQNHTISGIYIVSCKDNLRQVYGFWERLSNATIKNVRLKGTVNIENSTALNRGYLPETTAGNAYVGGLVGISSNSLFENCKVDMDVSYKRDHKIGYVILGGIAGLCNAKTGMVALRYCSHNGSLYAGDWDGTFCPPLIGGLIGNGSGVIEYCENLSAVIEGSLPLSNNHDHPSYFTMGGIVGIGGSVKFCRNIVKRMTAINYCQGTHYFRIGGIVGDGTSVTNSYSVIEKCEVNTASIWYGSGKVQIGGIISSSNSGSTANFSNSDMEKICGITIQKGYDGSTAYSANQMAESAFLDEINTYPQINLGKSIWTRDENGYPCIAQTHEGGTPDTNEPTAISVSPSSETIKVGESFTINYTLSPSNASTNVTWSSDNSDIATVSSSGTVTGVKVGSTNIYAKTSNGKSDYCRVTVEASEIQPTNISVSPSSNTIKVGESFTVSYTLSPSNASTNVTWSSDNSDIATVSPSGTVTGVKVGSTYINATTSNGKTDWCTVIVESGPTEKDIAINSTNFPDDNFRKYLMEQNYGKDGVITADEISTVKGIDVHDKNICDLNGIELFSALTYLKCSSNQLTSLDVSKNTALATLYCQSNQLSSLDVSKNTSLRTLRCESNQLSSLDVSKNTSLRTLRCESNQLSSLDVSNNIALRLLSCQSNQLSSLDVSNNIALTSLYCYSNQLSSLDVSKNTALTRLDCYSNQISSLDVSKNTALTSLSCHSNQLTSLDVTKNIELTYLACSTNQLTSLDVTKNIALTSLSCHSNQLTSLDVTKNIELTYLACSTNQLTSLDLSKNIVLKTLWTNNNQLTYLDILNNVVLESLYCGSNQLSSLDVSKNVALTSLSCYSNQLTSLDVSKNTELTSLSCYSNQLTSLDVSKNTALTSLSCYSNQLTSLDVSKNTALTSLSCGLNQLTSLDVSNNTELTSLSCRSNQLTSLDVSNNVALTSLYCYSNQIMGSFMDDLIKSLPRNTTNDEYIFCVVSTNSSEKNVCTTIQVEAAKAKGWTPYLYDVSQKKTVLYVGSSDNPTAITLPIFETVNVNETIQLTPTLIPSGVITTLTWESDDTSIAKVSQTGVVMGIKEGTAIISVTTSNNLKAECFVMVKDPTSIIKVVTDENKNLPIYTISGQRIEKPSKGINIIKGKKMIIK